MKSENRISLDVQPCVAKVGGSLRRFGCSTCAYLAQASLREIRETRRRNVLACALPNPDIRAERKSVSDAEDLELLPLFISRASPGTTEIPTPNFDRLPIIGSNFAPRESVDSLKLSPKRCEVRSQPGTRLLFRRQITGT